MKILEWIAVIGVLLVGLVLAPEITIPGVVAWALYKLNKK